MTGKMFTVMVVLLLLFSPLAVFQVFVPTVKAEESNIGYEFLDDKKVLRIWNTQDSYFFNVSSGVQFSNHYEEYWSHNVLMLGYYANEEWHLVYRVDELSGFQRTIETDNISYVNATLWKDLSYAGYNFRLALRYHLKVDDARLTVQPYIQNLGVAIDLDIGFAWRIKNIQIANNVENDKLFINGTSYFLNQTIDVTYRNMTMPIYDENKTLIGYEPTPYYYVVDQEDRVSRELYLGWNKNLTYLVQVKSVSEQYNAPITLAIKVGSLDSGQEKTTLFYWKDAEWTTPDAIHSFCGQSGAYTASKTIDEKIYTDDELSHWNHYEWCYHWIIYDMGETKKITKIRIYQYLDWVLRWGQTTGLYVYVGDDPADLGAAVWEGVMNADGWQESGAFDKNGRYVKLVSKDDSRHTGFYEFDAYAEAVAGDETAPTYSDVGTNTTVAGQPCKFYTKWTDETGLATTGGFIYGTNNSGTPTNETWTAFSANPDWSNKTLTLNNTVHARIEWWVYANDTSNNWNNTGTQAFTTTGTFTVDLSHSVTITFSDTETWSATQNLAFNPNVAYSKTAEWSCGLSIDWAPSIAYTKDIDWNTGLSLSWNPNINYDKQTKWDSTVTFDYSPNVDYSKTIDWVTGVSLSWNPNVDYVKDVDWATSLSFDWQPNVEFGGGEASVSDTFTDESKVASAWQTYVNTTDGHVRLADYDDPLYEYFNTGDDFRDWIFGFYSLAQTFTVGDIGHTVTSVKLKLYKTGNPGTLTISIRATDGNGFPTGEDLTSGTTDGNELPTGAPYEWREITFTEITLAANTMYAIVGRAPDGDADNRVNWREVWEDGYDFGKGYYTEDYEGSPWVLLLTAIFMFEVWGNPLGATYKSTGLLYSTNFLSEKSVQNIDQFNYTVSSLPAQTTLHIQFSQDNSTWYNSTGGSSWQTLSQGTNNTISLSGLGWSGANFYYRCAFNNTDDSTPKLDYIAVLYSKRLPIIWDSAIDVYFNPTVNYSLDKTWEAIVTTNFQPVFSFVLEVQKISGAVYNVILDFIANIGWSTDIGWNTHIVFDWTPDVAYDKTVDWTAGISIEWSPNVDYTQETEWASGVVLSWSSNVGFEKAEQWQSTIAIDYSPSITYSKTVGWITSLSLNFNPNVDYATQAGWTTHVPLSWTPNIVYQKTEQWQSTLSIDWTPNVEYSLDKTWQALVTVNFEPGFTFSLDISHITGAIHNVVLDFLANIGWSTSLEWNSNVQVDWTPDVTYSSDLDWTTGITLNWNPNVGFSLTIPSITFPSIGGHVHVFILNVIDVVLQPIKAPVPKLSDAWDGKVPVRVKMKLENLLEQPQNVTIYWYVTVYGSNKILISNTRTVELDYPFNMEVTAIIKFDLPLDKELIPDLSETYAFFAEVEYYRGARLEKTSMCTLFVLGDTTVREHLIYLVGIIVFIVVITIIVYFQRKLEKLREKIRALSQ